MNLPKRKSPRLKDFDYSSSGAYFITIRICKHGNLFQRSFYDHVIREDDEYLKIWEYIDTNPAKWTEDCFYSE